MSSYPQPQSQTQAQDQTPKPYSRVPAGATVQPEPFELHIPQQQIDDFKTLLRLSPIAKETYENAQTDRRYGVPRQWIVEAKRVWEGEYDWRKTESHINSFPNFTSTLPSSSSSSPQPLHFTALFSLNPSATPLALLHGWPGSILEFLPLLTLLCQKYTPETLPYHIIVPSLPGYTLSSSAQPPVDADRSWTYADIAAVVHNLLLSLGFGGGGKGKGKGYIVQGGDIGSSVARCMAATYAECLACHLNLNFMGKPDGVSDAELAAEYATYSAAEKTGLQRMKTFRASGTAYGQMHATRPSTLGLALSSSPLALLSWISEKFLAWSDADPPLSAILDSVSLYWFTGCFASTMYTYKEDFASPDPAFFHGQRSMYIDKPFGFSWFPMELAPVPRKWVERTGRLVFYQEHESGGHFAALERPEVLLADLERFVEIALEK
ncbi:alpha/beta-hydrolase [Lophiostoma macrostomum CBS 122681]|uniref:Alpha/beta-hydrolase n=1 Tax=Lophiostoma macrostomum CBS 122681 TaxID=1314788 RepID=A0A6A6TMK1_9PLEO|nr:alpha/beta-hydrolase [Lophiostoma macrostomum CBS 122681]